MEKLNALSTAQTVLGKSISQLLDNFKKEKLERRTAEITKGYEKRVHELWDKFCESHEQIEKCRQENLELEHPYFTKDYFGQVHKEYMDLTARISDRLREAKEAETTQPPSNRQGVQGQKAEERENILLEQQKLRNQLRATISALERIINVIEKESTVVQSKAYYTQKLKSINQYWENICTLHGHIMAEASDNTYDVKEYTDIEDRFQEVAIRLQEKLDEQPMTAAVNANVKLPKITLPKFDGNYTKWGQFKDLFTQLIHNRHMGGAERMYYLKANLTDEPSSLIKHLQATDENYAVAWKILLERYDNPRTIVTAILNELLTQPSLSIETSAGIKKLHDTSKECLLALENMGLQVKQWSPLLLHLLIHKLDKESRRLYEQSLKAPRELQVIDNFFTFLESRFQMLEVIQTKEIRKKPSTLAATTQIPKCDLCREDHKIFKCPKFLYASVEKRMQFIRQLKLCSNCLRADHKLKDCSSRGCSSCGKRHNTLIHNSHNQRERPFNHSSRHQRTECSQGSSQHNGKQPAVPERQVENFRPVANSIASGSLQTPASQQVSNTSLKASTASQILLATAVVQVITSSGVPMNCRVLLDSGSQLHFVCERLVQALGLPRRKVLMPITGIGGLETTAKYETIFTIRSRVKNFSAVINAVVLKTISDYQPSQYVDASNWDIPNSIQLADPGFYKPQAIDILLGADLYLQLLQEGQIRLNNNLPLLQNTQLGWILSGRVPTDANYSHACHIAQPSLTALDKQLQRFWELENHDSPSKYKSKEELDCEQHFQTTFQRSSSGRYMVRLPFREKPVTLGSSLEMAKKRFFSLERKLDRNADLKEQYCEFMREYQALGHMQIISRELIPANHYYMPHHCVVKADSSTTKLRVVFDASAKTSSGKSLNDIMMVGPTVQPDLFTIILKFRTYKYAMTADICKMYRQIKVHSNDRNYQLILWREDKNQPLQTYQLNTVTYGTAAAPFLATRCLNQLALAEYDTFPEAANMILGNTYVDDILTGANSIREILKLREDLIQLLKSGGFELKKFSANHPEILKNVPEENKEKMLIINDGEVTKTLGLIWEPKDDVFQYLPAAHESGQITKRTVLSEVARIFDPLGLVGPITVLGKLLVQELWRDKYTWDDDLPADYISKWNKFKTGLSGLSKLKFPRHIVFSDPIDVQLHAFSDSSESAFGACCYIRSINRRGEIRVRLLCSKSRLAPLKSTTLAKLELCAALLMVELVERVRQGIQINFSRVVYHTDSTIVLSWISAPSYTWNTFVAHRVEKIQQLSQPRQWRHIEGIQNPADIISRGMLPDALSQSMWLKGPRFLSDLEERWPVFAFKQPDNIPEAKHKRSALSATRPGRVRYDDLLEGMKHSNSYPKLQRIFAYCIRFIQNCKTPTNLRKTGELTISELDTALHGIIRNVQRTVFHEEYLMLKRGEELKSNHTLQNLTPFLDEATGIMRVGGRLKNSELAPDAKNQILLPKNHKLSELLFSYLHLKHMHAAPQTLIAIARQKYWVMDARNLARQIVNKCIRCFKCKPKTANQLMGDLPKERVTPARPFHTTGIDFCGPIRVHHRMRGKQPTKAYIAVFVCFTTKAVHLELVSDLSSEAFLNALKRFIGRRGLCATIFCDNATNFIGARSHLSELRDMFISEKLQSSISQLCSQNHIEWKPIPPRSPHFGGLWEAAVKSAKMHLVRQVGSANLTYEELQTVIVQIEAILNSRPITPMSSDPNDFEALTPGHFLTGSPLTAIAEPDVSNENIDRLTRFHQIEHIRQKFWQRWSSEYLQELQTRSKWRTKLPNLTPGTLVLIREAKSDPLQWSLGRVLETFAGPDNLTRAVNVKTANGILKRSIHNLCPLPEYNQDPNARLVKNHEDQEKPKSSGNEPVRTQPTTCLLTLQASNSKKGKEDEPPIKRRKPKLPYHPLRGRFLPINPNWANSSTAAAKLPTNSMAENTSDTTTKPINSSATLIFFILVLLILPICGHPIREPITVTPITNNPGIFYETLGHAQFINSHWSILTYFDLDNYWYELKGIKTCISAIGELCNTTTLRRNHCLEIFAQFQHQLSQIEDTNEIFHKQGGGDRFLTKRSPLDIVGNIANKLFGILDSSYAKYIEDEIKQTRKNEDYLLQLFKNQTSVLEATTNVIKKQEESIQLQFKAIHDYMSTFKKVVDDIQREKEATQAFNALSLLTTLVLQSYHQMQAAFLDVITNIHHSKVSPVLITPRQLQAQLTVIKEHIPSTLIVPGDKGNGRITLYNLMTAGAKITGSYLLFDVRIPLVLNEHFQLFKLIPIPIQQDDRLLLIKPSTDYLIVSLPRDRHYPLTQTEFEGCRHMEDDQYLCHQNHPIYNLRANISQCEMDLLNHRQPTSTKCHLRTSSRSNLWIQLHAPNSWLYSLSSETTFNIVCGTTVTLKTLGGCGVLRLRPDCSIKQTSMTITGHGRYQSRIMSAFIPRINISDLLNSSVTNKQVPASPELHLRSNDREIETLTSKIKELKEASLSPGISHHDVHHYTLSYLLLASIIIICSYWIISRGKCTKRISQPSSGTEQTPPIPAKRTNRPVHDDFVLHSNPRGQDV